MYNIIYTIKTSILDIKKTFWEKVRKLRTEKHLSQEEFARKCGVHRTYMWLIERWETNITFEHIEKIAKTLDVKINDIFINID